MTSLDTLARSAADAIHESVADVGTPVAGLGVATGSAAAWRMARYAAAGAVAGAAVVAVLLVAPPTEDETTQDSTVPPTTQVTTTQVTTTVDESVVTTTIAGPRTATTLPAPDTEVPIAVPRDQEEPPEAAPDTEPPILEIRSPANGEHLETRTVKFSGITEPGATVVASGKFAAKVAPDGSWSIDLLLVPGANGVVFAAADDAGNTTEARMTVYYDVDEPKETTTTTTKAVEWEFTASQKYGSCSEPIPYDEFSGKAKPGSIVTVTSSYGGGSTTVDGEGNYWLKVEFPSAPFGEVFSIKVTDEFGNRKTFEFVSDYTG